VAAAAVASVTGIGVMGIPLGRPWHPYLALATSSSFAIGAAVRDDRPPPAGTPKTGTC